MWKLRLLANDKYGERAEEKRDAGRGGRDKRLTLGPSCRSASPEHSPPPSLTLVLCPRQRRFVSKQIKVLPFHSFPYTPLLPLLLLSVSFSPRFQHEEYS